MDQNRQIRFVIPPFFFLLIVGLNVLCAWTELRATAHLVDLKLLVPLVAVAAAAVPPLGFTIGTISAALLSWWFKASDGSYEASVQNFDEVWTTVMLNPKADKANNDEEKQEKS